MELLTVYGVLHENLIDWQRMPETVEQLRHTPSSALESCRRKLDRPI